MEVADFSGYVTKAGLKCSDGRTITAEAFKHMDGKKVPLVWQHVHNNADNILGHVLLEARNDGMYGYGFFNNNKQGINAKGLVEHQDITSLSIYANQLIEKAKTVLHGVIGEVSLVLAGANPGAFIDYINIAHADGDVEVMDDEAIIYTGLSLEHNTMTDTSIEAESVEETLEETLEHAAATSDMTVREVYDTFDEIQKNVVHFMLATALEGQGTAAHSGTEGSPDEEVVVTLTTPAEGDLEHQEGNT